VAGELEVCSNKASSAAVRLRELLDVDVSDPSGVAINALANELEIQFKKHTEASFEMQSRKRTNAKPRTKPSNNGKSKH